MSPYCYQMGHSEPSSGTEGATGVETADPDTGSPSPSPSPSITPSPPPAHEEYEEGFERYEEMNPPPMLQNESPDCLPIDHNLPNLLRQVSGNADLTTIRDIKLRVISREMSLQRLALFIPNLRELNLDGSCLGSLRDLGCGLTSLQVLRVSRCGLESLDGTFGIASLRELHASINRIDDIGPCSSLQHLRIIDLSKNAVEDISFVEFLNMCSHLEELKLEGCPAASKPGYRPTICRLLPNLVTLDDIPTSKNRGDGENNADDYNSPSGTGLLEKPMSRGDSVIYQSPRSQRHYGDSGEEDSYFSKLTNSPSTSSSSYQADISQEFSDIKISPERSSDTINLKKNQVTPANASVKMRRPATTEGITETSGVKKRGPLSLSTPMKPRPASASSAPDEIEMKTTCVGDSPSPLTSGKVVCGNLTMAMRSRKKRQGAWMEEESASQEEEEFASNCIFTDIKSDDSQEMRADEKKATAESLSSDDSDVLQESKRWREAYSEYRLQNRSRWEKEDEEEEYEEAVADTYATHEKKPDRKEIKPSKPTDERKVTIAVKKSTQPCCPHLFSRQKPTLDTSYDADNSSDMSQTSETVGTAGKKKLAHGQPVKKSKHTN